MYLNMVDEDFHAKPTQSTPVTKVRASRIGSWEQRFIKNKLLASLGYEREEVSLGDSVNKIARNTWPISMNIKELEIHGP